MSALVAWGVSETALPAPRLPHRRPNLAIDTTTDQQRRSSLDAPTPAVAAPRVRLRLTPRGRLVRSLLVFSVLTLIALARWSPATEADQLTVDRHRVVRPGQTLSQIARAELPQLPIREAVVRLQLANNLAAPEVSVGQTLAIPLGR